MSGDYNPATDWLRRRHCDPPTLRDQFAMAALTGLLASPATDPEDGTCPMAYCDFAVEEAADSAYAYADAMMEARITPVKPLKG